MKRLKRNLDKNKILLADYINIIKDYIDEGIVEDLEPETSRINQAQLIIYHIERLSEKTIVQRKFVYYGEINESKYLCVKYKQSLYKNDSKFEKIKNSLNLFVDENFLFRRKSRFNDFKNLQ